MNKIFITGMGRSGTTLVDKLLTNHQNIDVLSQPTPLFFIEAKKRFLKRLGIDKYFVLNDDLRNRDFTQNKFDSFLSNFSLNLGEIEALFEKMSTYSGQQAKREQPGNNQSILQNGFLCVLEKCTSYYRPKEHCSFLGIKEIMCEEFLPYLCKSGFKCILILRDPRDVLASANYPKGEKYLGGKKPTLFILRSWRKSVEYASLLKDNENFHFLRYEDLIENPYRELERITDYLGVSRFPKNHFDRGVFDRNGELWQANSSFDIHDSFISKRPKEMYKRTLKKEEIAYTEAVCELELNWLNYEFHHQHDAVETIKNFKDDGLDDLQNLPTDFSSESTQISSELKRLDEFKDFFSEPQTQ